MVKIQTNHQTQNIRKITKDLKKVQISPIIFVKGNIILIRTIMVKT